MAMNKARFAETYSTGSHPSFESEGSDSLARLDGITAYPEDPMASRQKWIDVNSTSCGGFDVPVQVVALPRLTSSEQKSLSLRLKSELEKVQALNRKVEQLLSSNSSSSVTNVPSGPQVLQSNKPLGLVSKPGKKSSSLSNKVRGWNRSSSGRFQAVNDRGHVSNSKLNPAIMKMCENVLKKLMSHQYGWVFNTPVDAVKLNIPDYYTVIKHPMDLGTIKKKLASGEYPSPLEFCADVKLTFSNAKTYNPSGNDVHIMAEAMSKLFELRWKDVEKKFPTLLQSLPEKSGSPPEMEVVKTATVPTKKRKLSPLQHLVIPEPVKPQMSAEEKCKLGNELESLLEDLPENILSFLKDQICSAGESAEEEIELDIDELNDEALFTLRKLLDVHLLEKQKIAEKGEPCEIELPNESGLSSSSMQADKGNGPVDEDVDIKEDEPPVSSYPAAEIERDEASRPSLSDRKHVLGTCDHSDGEVESDAFTAAKPTLVVSGARASHEKEIEEDMAEGNQSISGLDQLEQCSLEKPKSDEMESPVDGESAPAAQTQLSPERRYRAALLKNRFADTILKAREKTLGQVEKGDPEKLRREREELELQKRRERARLQAEAKAAEDAKRRAEAAAAAEARKKRELEREAARQALLKIEQTVEINENSRFLEDLEMLRAGSLEQLPSSVDETSPDDQLQEGFGSFKFGAGNNPLEQLGLYMKVDEDDEDGEQHNNHHQNPSPPSLDEDDVEEGEID